MTPKYSRLEAILMNKLDENVGTKKDLLAKLEVNVVLFGCFIVKPIL